MDGGVVVARLVLNINLVNDRIDILAAVGIDCLLDIPACNLAVQKQCRVGITAPVKGGMQRSQTQFRLGDNDIAWFDLVVEQVRQAVDVDH